MIAPLLAAMSLAGAWHAVPDQAPATLTCTVTSVHDGDGPIRCRERGPDGKPIKIRLHAIAAREIDESCSPGHPCPAASGAAAKAALTRFASGQVLACEPTGTSYARVTAWCSTAAGVDLSCAMVRGGFALRWEKFDREGRLCAEGARKASSTRPAARSSR